MYTTRRKTGFVGFLLAIKSIKGIFQDFVEPVGAPLRYLLTYKLSQDHLELFFGAVRSAGGFNNNPTAQQFTAAYKRLLLRSSIGGGKGNCQKRDPTDILYLLSDTCNVNDEDVTIGEAALIRKYDLAVKTPCREIMTIATPPALESFLSIRLQPFHTLQDLLERWHLSKSCVAFVVMHWELETTMQNQIF